MYIKQQYDKIDIEKKEITLYATLIWAILKVYMEKVAIYDTVL